MKKTLTQEQVKVFLDALEVKTGKKTLLEAIATELEYGIIHFPSNEFSEKMIIAFFQKIHTLPLHNIIIFDNIDIDFDNIQEYNNQLYTLFEELINNDSKNIFIFTFNNLKTLPFMFRTHFNIHHHYHMDTNIDYVMNYIKDKLIDCDIEMLTEIRNNFLQINPKITPGNIIPYLIFNEDLQKSLDRFFRLIKN